MKRIECTIELYTYIRALEAVELVSKLVSSDR